MQNLLLISFHGFTGVGFKFKVLAPFFGRVIYYLKLKHITVSGLFVGCHLFQPEK